MTWLPSVKPCYILRREHPLCLEPIALQENQTSNQKFIIIRVYQATHWSMKSSIREQASQIQVNFGNFAIFPQVWRKSEIKDFPETFSNERHTDKIFRNRNRHSLWKLQKVPLVILKVPLDILIVSSLASYLTQRNTARCCSQQTDSKCFTQVDDTSVDVQVCFFSLHLPPSSHKPVAYSSFYIITCCYLCCTEYSGSENVSSKYHKC